MTRPEDNKGWAVVPGTEEKAPILDIVVLFGACVGLLAGGVAALMSFAVTFAAAGGWL